MTKTKRWDIVSDNILDDLQEMIDKPKNPIRQEVAIRGAETTCLDECSYMSEEMWDEAIDSLARTKGLG